MDRGACWAAVHGVAEGRTPRSDFTLTFHFHALEKEMATPLQRSCQGWGSLVGCCLWGRTESDTTEATKQQQQQRRSRASQVALLVKNPPADAGDIRDLDLIPGLGRSLE